ncbi:Protein CBG25954 [Caenorhabditis briggsae]
MRNKK